MGSDTTSESGSSPSTNELYLLLLPQAFVGLVDAISMMVVAPSLVFYVLELGGTKENYGIILSAFSFASFLFKPVLGYWCDKSGYQFRQPYLVSLSAAMMGGFLYFYASAFTGKTAIVLTLMGRALGGIGAASSILGFTYIAQVIPPDKMTKMSSVLSMVRVLGMVTAPGMNVLLGKMSGFSILSVPVTPLNSVGLFLMLANALSCLSIYFTLKEPPEETKPDASSAGKSDHSTRSQYWSSFLSLDILLPILSILVLNANFQLLETGLTPAASDIMGWGPIAISTAFGSNSIVMLGIIITTFQLSSMGVTDEQMIEVGCILSIVGYGSLYFNWTTDNNTIWQFVTPFVLCTSAFPFLAAPTRSYYTKVVASKPSLRTEQGSMQAIMSMAASVAGFAAPGLIAAFVLRTPQEVVESKDHREFTPLALFAPILSIILYGGFVYLRLTKDKTAMMDSADDDEEQVLASETTRLLDDANMGQRPVFYPVVFQPRIEAYRRNTVTLMGIPQLDLQFERNAKVTRKTVLF